jgi:hypothetical protein
LNGWFERRDRTADRTIVTCSNDLIITLLLCHLTKINFFFRLAQLREGGVQFRIRQQYEALKTPDTQPSSIVVNLETIAPILALLAAGNVIGLLILETERRVSGYLHKTWPHGNNR